MLLLVRLQNIPAVEDHVYTRVVWSKAREINKWLVRNDETFAIFLSVEQVIGPNKRV